MKNKKNAPKGSRSRRKTARRPKGSVLSVDADSREPSVELQLPIADVLSGLQESVEQLSIDTGLLVMKCLIEEEVERRVGKKGKHDPDREARRHGREDGYVAFAGKKMPFERPRVRSVDGSEVSLERYEHFQEDGQLQRAVGKHVLAGVATRDYGKVVDEVCDGYGVEKSSVSRHWKALSTKKLEEFLARPLGELGLVAVMIDGVGFDEYTLVVALGIDSTGRKHMLGVWLGATETAQVSKQLLADLIKRGLPQDQSLLFVLDGSKALHKAVTDTFGELTHVQRCQIHKERNVLDHLPKSHHRAVRMRLNAAWGMKHYSDAKGELKKLVDYLDELNPSAARSLEEGMEETLTIHRLELPDSLRKTLRSTNPIENCFSFRRKYCRNVKRWSSADMVLRWSSAMLLEVEKRFRKIRGFRNMPQLIAALSTTNMDTKKASA